jgi:hypothetical protein
MESGPTPTHEEQIIAQAQQQVAARSCAHECQPGPDDDGGYYANINPDARCGGAPAIFG